MSLYTPKFSACDRIAEFYDALNISSQKTARQFGGKSYTWEVPQKDQTFQVRCACSMSTLGFAAINIEPKITNDQDRRVFLLMLSSPVVDFKTGKITSKNPFDPKKSETHLPMP